jgi:hypothetical protein
MRTTNSCTTPVRHKHIALGCHQHVSVSLRMRASDGNRTISVVRRIISFENIEEDCKNTKSLSISKPLAGENTRQVKQDLNCSDFLSTSPTLVAYRMGLLNYMVDLLIRDCLSTQGASCQVRGGGARSGTKTPPDDR